MKRWLVTRLTAVAAPCLIMCALGGVAQAATVGNFSYGQLQSALVGASGCGTNSAGEPAIHVSRANNAFLGSELGLGGGSQLWRGLGAIGGATASGCGLEYRGQPNAVTSGLGASGGDIDLANASATNSSGNYNLYVASLNLGSVNVATSTNNGTTFSQTPVQAGLPGDDREWIAAFGAGSSLLTFCLCNGLLPRPVKAGTRPTGRASSTPWVTRQVNPSRIGTGALVESTGCVHCRPLLWAVLSPTSLANRSVVRRGAPVFRQTTCSGSIGPRCLSEG